tara:strand:- start:88 stop:324 length:237 start_codon:yes stop_codon:yes gene_type:complete
MEYQNKNMNLIKKYYQKRLISHSIIPYKVKRLETGAIIEYYLNGKTKVSPCTKYIPETCGNYIATSFIDLCPTCKTGI